MKYYDLTEFLRLSAVLNYQLSAKTVDWNNIATIILRKKDISDYSRDVLLNVMDYLGNVYGKKKRRLGSLSVLHPLRATVLFSVAQEKPELLDLLTILLHDNFEDINPKNFHASNWSRLDAKFQAILDKLSNGERWFLMERLQWLTKTRKETYYSYIGRLLHQAKDTPEVVRVKLADRLDNTLDMRIDLEDPLDHVDFFAHIFQVMFINTYNGYIPDVPHQSSTALNGAQRLYQLFKNIILMSLIRQRKAVCQDHIARELFESLALASMKEAQRIALHIIGYHNAELESLRELLIETMTYVQKGGIDTVTSTDQGTRLDGLFVSRFDDSVKRSREKKLADLYTDKPLMLEASIAFIVIFLSYLNDPDYYVRGISEEGIYPKVVV